MPRLRKIRPDSSPNPAKEKHEKPDKPAGGGPMDRGAGEGDIGPRKGLTGIQPTRHPLPGNNLEDTEIPEGTV